MDYATFKRLVAAGEKATVDFKIRCDALGGGTTHNGELAKDICAMCNNGNVKSYLVIGVSDDGKHFTSVTNRKLTDDNLQTLCKKAIVPPPRVSLHRRTWREHRGVEFVIIEVGPHRRQAYCLGQDFIDYDQRICLRRHEVWIRRNATSDLATPDEVARLAQGKPPQEDDDETIRAARLSFSEASDTDRRRLVNGETEAVLKQSGYKQLVANDATKVWLIRGLEGGTHSVQVYYKKIGMIALLICRLVCCRNLSQGNIENLRYFGFFLTNFADWKNIPHPIAKLTRRRVRAVRRISLLPVLGRVPKERIVKALPDVRKCGRYQHYYWPELRVTSRGEPDVIKSSTEMLVLDGITSLVEYRAELEAALKTVEVEAAVIVDPHTSHI